MSKTFLAFIFIFIFSGIDHLYSYAGEVEIEKLNFQFPKDKVKVGETFELIVTASGKVENQSGHEKALLYPSLISLKEIHLINVLQSHHINYISKSAIEFSFRLKFQFKATKAGDYVLPNLPIAFPYSEPFTTTPQKEITVEKDFFLAYKAYLIIGGIFIFIIYTVLFIKFTPKNAEKLLEKKVYRRFSKIKFDNNIKLSIHKLIINYLNKKFKNNSFRFTNIKDLNKFQFTEEQNFKLLRVWNYPFDNLSSEKKEELDEYFKTFLYIFQDLEINPVELRVKGNSG